MRSFEQLAGELVDAVGDDDLLLDAYSSLLEELFRCLPWSPTNPQGRRIPWRAAEAARNSMREAFDIPGLYIFGGGEVPLYVGRTGQTLWKRLRGRYVKGPRSQCQLAATYEDALREKGIDGFPADVREWYRRGFGKSTVRLRHAVAFARHKPRTIWFTPLPVSEEPVAKQLEARLIPLANEWSVARGHEPLLNMQHT